LFVVEFLEVLELRLPHQLASSAWGKWSSQCFFASLLSEEVSARVYVFVSDGVGLQFVETVSCCCSSSCVRKLLDFANLSGWSPVTLVVRAGVSHSQVDGDREQSSSLASSLGFDSVRKRLSVLVVPGLLSK